MDLQLLKFSMAHPCPAADTNTRQMNSKRAPRCAGLFAIIEIIFDIGFEQIRITLAGQILLPAYCQFQKDPGLPPSDLQHLSGRSIQFRFTQLSHPVHKLLLLI